MAAETISAEIVNGHADELERQHADDVWRSAAAQHLRSAATFLGHAEREDERKRIVAEEQAKHDAEREAEATEGKSGG